MGPAVVRALLLPQLPAYVPRLQPLLPDWEAGPANHSGGAGDMEVDGVDFGSNAAAAAATLGASDRHRQQDHALRVHGALVDAAAGALYQLMTRTAAGVLLPPGGAIVKRYSTAVLVHLQFLVWWLLISIVDFARAIHRIECACMTHMQ